jgi:predicted Zn finger-like uncharacterized protein
MKITCSSCPAKYTIADEKVAGKIVKIRCKKCGATIVVNGAEGAAAAAPAGAAAATESDGAWMVNVADGDQRTLSVDEVVTEYRAGVVHEDTYCWRDGMEDWLALRDIPELMAAVSTGFGGNAQAFGSAPPPNLQYGGPDVFGSSAAPRPNFADDDGATAMHPAPSALAGASMGSVPPPAAAPMGSPFGAAQVSAFGGAAAANRGGRGAAGDLFGSAATAGAESEFSTQSMPPPGNAQLTGQRNENSVLFSLGALTSAGAPKVDNRTTAEGDGSGLIDIRALSASMNQSSTSSSSKVDDIMNLGGGGAFNAALTAPVLAPPTTGFDGPAMGVAAQPQGGGNKGLLIALIGVVGLLLLTVCGGGAYFLTMKPTTTVVTPPGGASGVAITPTPNTVAPTADTSASGEPSAVGPQVGTAVSTATAKAGAIAVGPKPTADTSAKPATSTSAVVAAAEPPKPKNLSDAIRDSVPGTKATETPPANNDAPPFDRGAASAALNGVNVASCKKADGPTGSGHVQVTFAPSGAVQSAVADAAPFAGTPVGGCVAGKFRGARIPAFRGAAMTVGKSFSIN